MKPVEPLKYPARALQCSGESRTQTSEDAQKQASPSHGFPPGPQASQKRPAETYKDSDVSGGADDGSRWRGFFGDVLHSDGSQMDSCWQPDDHLALMPL